MNYEWVIELRWRHGRIVRTINICDCNTSSYANSIVMNRISDERFMLPTVLYVAKMRICGGEWCELVCF